MEKSLKLPAIILAIGLILALVACLLINIVMTPTITEQDFSYSVTYQLGGETKTLEGVYRCRFDGYSEGNSPRERYYSGEYIVDGQATSRTYTIAQKDDGSKLYIVITFNDWYLMGDTKDLSYNPTPREPFLEALDHEGAEYDEAEMPSEFAAQIVSWEYPEPIENTFVFSGFSLLHTGSMLSTLAVGLLVIVACLVFVKKDKTAPAKSLDSASAVLNFVVVLLGIPFMTILASLFQLTLSGDNFLYQYFLCIPALTAFTVAASIALRRANFTNSGFWVQFAGPVLFFIPIVLEAVITNIFG